MYRTGTGRAATAAKQGGDGREAWGGCPGPWSCQSGHGHQQAGEVGAVTQPAGGSGRVVKARCTMHTASCRVRDAVATP